MQFTIRYFVIFIFAVFVLMLTRCKSSQEESAPDISLPQVDSTEIRNERLLSFLKKQKDAYLLPWSLLTNVAMIDTIDAMSGMDISLPVFNDTLLALNGKQVILEGFYIPVEETKDDKIVILSAFPFAQCFFCGKAGIESIVDVLTKDRLPTLKTDARIRFSGRLRLNRDDFDYLIYILDDAKYIGTIQ